MSNPLYPGVALITGAGSSIGRRTAVSFAASGCLRIAITDTSEQDLDATALAIMKTNPRVKLLCQLTDVSSAAEVAELFSATVTLFGRIDYAVNAAAIIAEDFVVDKGLVLCSGAEIAQMRTQQPLPTHDGRVGSRGVIVNVAPPMGVGARSNAAVVEHTKADAAECGQDNIRVNCVCPGMIETEEGEEVTSAPLVARKGTAQEVADCVLFLASSKASFVLGSAMVVDGGRSVG